MWGASFRICRALTSSDECTCPSASQGRILQGKGAASRPCWGAGSSPTRPEKSRASSLLHWRSAPPLLDLQPQAGGSAVWSVSKSARIRVRGRPRHAAHQLSHMFRVHTGISSSTPRIPGVDRALRSPSCSLESMVRTWGRASTRSKCPVVQSDWEGPLVSA